MTSEVLCLSTRRCRVHGRPDWTPARVDVRHGVIEAVHPLDEAPPPPDGATSIDLGDRLLVPSFVNAHTHLALQGLRGAKAPAALQGNLVEDVFFRWETALGPEDVRAFTRVAALECALHGIGVVFDHYYHAEAVAAGLRDVGLAGVIAPTLQDLDGPGRDHAETALAATEALRADAWSEAGIVPAVGPHATDTVSAELWRRALELAERHGLALHAHVAQSAEEARRCLDRHGVSPVAWLEREGLLHVDVPQLLVHVLYLDDADLARLDPTRHVLGSCPFSQVQFGFPAPIEEFEDRGLPWFVGTDCGPSNDSMNVQQELRLLAGQSTYAVSYGAAHAALRGRVERATVDAVERERRTAAERHGPMRTPEVLLRSVTDGPGSWHPGLRTGAIEPGRRADLAVYDPRHPALWPADDLLVGLVYADLSPALCGLMVGGRWICPLDDVGALLRRDEVGDWIEEASRRAAALHARIR